MVHIGANKEGCTGCRMCEIACAARHFGVMNPKRSRIIIRVESRDVDAPTVCSHCYECLDVCPSDALSKDQRTGAIILNQEACDQCHECIGSCPHEAIFLDPSTGFPLICDLCGGGEQWCIKWCPRSVLSLKGRM